MYDHYFGFRACPFSGTADPHYFYPNPHYQDAYLGLLTAIRERQGFFLLTGESGTGKTTLVRRVKETVAEKFQTLYVPYCPLSFEELLTFPCANAEMTKHALATPPTLGAMLKRCGQTGAPFVLFLDEAQDLPAEILEYLRPLLQLKMGNRPFLSIVLAGNPTLERKLKQVEFSDLWDRIDDHIRLLPLAAGEVRGFIDYRLSMVGSHRYDLFSEEAIHRIARYSQGIPRLINTFCDNALLATYLARDHTVSVATIEDIAHELLLSEVLLLGKKWNPEQPSSDPPLPVSRHTAPPLPPPHYPGGIRRWPQPSLWGGLAILLMAFVLFKVLQDSQLSLLTLQPTEQLAVEPAAFSQPPETPEQELSQPGRRVEQSPAHVLPSAKGREIPGSLEDAHAATLQPIPQQDASAASRQARSPQPTPALRAFPSSTKIHVTAQHQRGETKSAARLTQMARQKKQREEAQVQLAQLRVPVTEAALLENGENGNLLAVTLLLTAGVSPNARDHQGWTALMLAARDKHPDLVQALLASGANVNARNNAGATALMMAAMNNRPALVHLLLAHGAQINAKNAQGWTALMYAAWKGYRPIVEDLLSKGADAGIKDKDGWTALMYARWQNDTPRDQPWINEATAAVLGHDSGAIDLGSHREYSEIAGLLQQGHLKR